MAEPSGRGAVLERPNRRARGPAQPRAYRREAIAAYLMLLPAVLPYIAFAVLPIGWLIWYSFHEYNGYTEPTWVGTANYERVWRDQYWWEAVVTTFQFAAGQVLITIPLALALAYGLFRGIRGAVIFKTIYFLPYVISVAIIGIIFRFFLRETGGPLNAILLDAGLIDRPIKFLGDATNALLSLIGVGAWSFFGIVVLLFLAGMATIPKEMIESAGVDGCGEFRTFWHIVLPLIRPVLRVVVLILILGTLRVFDLVKTLTDGGPAGATDVMFTYLFRYFFQPDTIPQIGYAAALGVVASVIVAIASCIYLLSMRARDIR